mmetsp:Transcript_27974/g.54628  ORF Transcript_27974/g.54628 Transcript_27974/m.54628 type:complete len:895 (+) Transcript_27974:516-3200(+)
MLPSKALTPHLRLLHAGGGLPEEGVEDDEVEHRPEDRQEHNREPDLEKVDERDVRSLNLSLGRHDNVGRGADEGAVAAEARPEGERPGEGLDRDAGHLLDELEHDGDHGGGEGDVVDKGREDSRGPHDQHNREDLARRKVGRPHHARQRVSDETQQAQLAHALNNDEESGEEEKRVPLHPQQSLVAVVHVKGDEEPYGTHDGDPGGVEMRHGVQEEGRDHAAQHHAALDEEGAVGDGVHLLELDDVDCELPLDGIAVVPREVSEDKGRHKQNAGSKVEQERVEVKVLGEHVADDDVGGVSDHRGCPSDVGEDSLADEVGAGINADQLAQLTRHGGDEKDGGHVVEKRREHRSHKAQEEEELGLVAARKLAGKHARPLEHTSAHSDANDKHHTPKKTQRAVVHPPNHSGQRGNPVLETQDDEGHGGANHGSHGAVHRLGGDEREDEAHDQRRDADLVGAGPAEGVELDSDRHGVNGVSRDDEHRVEGVLRELELEELALLLLADLVVADLSDGLGASLERSPRLILRLDTRLVLQLHEIHRDVVVDAVVPRARERAQLNGVEVRGVGGGVHRPGQDGGAVSRSALAGPVPARGGGGAVGLAGGGGVADVGLLVLAGGGHDAVLAGGGHRERGGPGGGGGRGGDELLLGHEVLLGRGLAVLDGVSEGLPRPAEQPAAASKLVPAGLLHLACLAGAAVAHVCGFAGAGGGWDLNARLDHVRGACEGPHDGRRRVHGVQLARDEGRVLEVDVAGAEDQAHEDEGDGEKAEKDLLLIDRLGVVPLLVHVLKLDHPLEPRRHTPLLDRVARLGELDLEESLLTLELLCLLVGDIIRVPHPRLHAGELRLQVADLLELILGWDGRAGGRRPFSVALLDVGDERGRVMLSVPHCALSNGLRA